MATLSQDDISIRVNTSANNSGLSSAKSSLGELKDATEKVSVGSKLAGVATQAFSFAAGIALADLGAKTGQFVHDAINAYGNYEAAQAQIAQVLTTTGKNATISVDGVEKVAKSMSSYSGQTETAVMQGQTLLLQFSQVSQKNLPEYSKAMLDLSQRMGISATDAAKQLGIALDDPTAGMTRLRRSGIDFTESQKESIKSMQKSGDLAGADALLMQSLEQRVGGAAGAFGNTFPGEIAKAKAALEEFEIKGVGKVKDELNKIDWPRYVKDLQNFADHVLQAYDKVWNYLKPSLEALWKTFSEKLMPAMENFWKNIIEPLIPVIGGTLVVALKLALDALNFLFDAITPLINFMADHKGVVEGLAGAFLAVKASMALSDVIAGLEGSFQVFMLTTLPALDGALSTTAASFLAAVPVALILAELATVADAAFRTFQTLSNTQNAIKSMQKSQDAVIPVLEGAAVAGATPQQRAAASRTLHTMGVKGYATGGYTGSGADNEIAGVVHKGEYVLPKSAVNQHTGQPKGGAGMTVTIGQVIIQTPQAAQEFFRQLDQDTLLVSKGLTPNRGMI